MPTLHPKLAGRMTRIRPSPTAALSGTVRKMLGSGRQVANLGEGELDFDTPDHIKDSAVAAIQRGETKYTDVGGTAELLSAIQDKFASANGLDFSNDEIMAGSGAKQLIFNALFATLESGDEVVIPEPYWVSYPDVARFAGATPVSVQCREESGFKLQPDDLRRALTDRTRWLILNSPNNPSGAVFSLAELEAIAEVLGDYPQVLVLADEIYEHITFAGAHVSFAAITGMRERTLTVNGLSKAHSMTGWRLGYAGGPAWLIEAMQIIQSQSTTNPNSIAQAAAVTALRAPLDFFTSRRSRLEKRRDSLIRMIERTQGVLKAAPPDGAIYVFANCAGAIGARMPDGKVIETDVDLAAYLLEEAGVAVMPGTAFGMSPYLRIAFAVEDEILEKALDALLAACQKLHPQESA